MPPLMSFSSIKSISILVINSNETLVIFKHACHAKLGADKKRAGSNPYISIHIFLKFLNTSASCKVSA